MSHNCNNRSSKGAFALCMAVFIAAPVFKLSAQNAADSEPTTESSLRLPATERVKNGLEGNQSEDPDSVKSETSNDSKPASAKIDIASAPPAVALVKEDRVLSEKYRKALVIDFNGPIFGSRHAYLNNRLDRAQNSDVDLIIIRLTSPGGLLVESVQLARRLSEIDWATTVAYIPEEAISGGAIIALGCDRIYMRQRSLMGDAGPIVLGPDGVFEHVEEKSVSYLHVAMRELAEKKGRPSALASAMADRSLKVRTAKHKLTGEVKYFTEQSLSPEDAENYELGESVPETGENRFLTVNGVRAVELDLADGIFESEDELLAALSFDSRNETRMTWVDRTVYLLNRPWLTGLLLFIALIALYIELAAPGISVAGITSLACFFVFFWSHALGGTSGWLEVLIFVLGVVCIVVEIFLLPGFGVFGLSGVLLVLLSLIMATQDFVLPNTKIEWEQLQKNSLIVLGSVAVVGILLIAQLLFLDSLPGLKRFQLRTPGVDGELSTEVTELLASPVKVEAILPNVGEQGVAESVLRPSGKVFFNHQLVDVVTEGDYLDPGTAVEVIRREGNRVIVRKLT